jgi:hypothetical protein
MNYKWYMPKQDEYVSLFLLYEGPHVLEIYTHKVQAEAAMRYCKEQDKKRGVEQHYYIREMYTVPLDNNV